MKKFDYFRPETLDEVLSLLQQYGDGAMLIAGGTDVLVLMRQQAIAPRALVSLSAIPGLDQIRDEGSLRIGALATHRMIEKSALVRKNFPPLADAAEVIASIQIRNVATLVGNICTAAPSADMAPPLLVLNAEARVVGKRGERRLPLESFFLGPGETRLAKDEILTEILVPPPLPGSAGCYLKLGRRKCVDLALVGVAVLLTMHPQSKVCERARIALGAVSPTPIRAKEAEKLLEGKLLDEQLIRQAGECARGECSPITDIRSSAEYRREMVQVLVERAIKKSLNLPV